MRSSLEDQDCQLALVFGRCLCQPLSHAIYFSYCFHKGEFRGRKPFRAGATVVFSAGNTVHLLLDTLPESK